MVTLKEEHTHFNVERDTHEITQPQSVPNTDSKPPLKILLQVKQALKCGVVDSEVNQDNILS